MECVICLNTNCYTTECEKGHDSQCTSCILNNGCKCCVCGINVDMYFELFKGYAENERLFIDALQLFKGMSEKCLKPIMDFFPMMCAIKLAWSEWTKTVDHEPSILFAVLDQVRYCIFAHLFPENADKKRTITSALFVASFVKNNNLPKISKRVRPKMYSSDPSSIEDFRVGYKVFEFSKLLDENGFKNIAFLDEEYLSDDELSDFEEGDYRLCDESDIFFGLVFNSMKEVFAVAKNTVCTCNRIDCETCNNGLYCSVCLSDPHGECSLDKVDADEYKMCPGCRTLVTKIEGCDDMWCLKCKVFFSWRQGVVRTDTPHNPDYIDSINHQDLFDMIFNYSGKVGEYNEALVLLTYLFDEGLFFLSASTYKHACSNVGIAVLNVGLANYILKVDDSDDTKPRSMGSLFKIKQAISAYEELVQTLFSRPARQRISFGSKMTIDTRRRHVYYNI